MTHNEVRVLEDGTRVYASYNRYVPVPVEERKIGINKPDHPGAQRFHTRWFLPLDVLPDEQRVWPQTRPDTDAYDHMEITALCRCEPCCRPQADRWRRRWLREKNRDNVGG